MECLHKPSASAFHPILLHLTTSHKDQLCPSRCRHSCMPFVTTSTRQCTVGDKLHQFCQQRLLCYKAFWHASDKTAAEAFDKVSYIPLLQCCFSISPNQHISVHLGVGQSLTFLDLWWAADSGHTLPKKNTILTLANKSINFSVSQSKKKNACLDSPNFNRLKCS